MKKFFLLIMMGALAAAGFVASAAICTYSVTPGGKLTLLKQDNFTKIQTIDNSQGTATLTGTVDMGSEPAFFAEARWASGYSLETFDVTGAGAPVRDRETTSFVERAYMISGDFEINVVFKSEGVETVTLSYEIGEGGELTVFNAGDSKLVNEATGTGSVNIAKGETLTIRLKATGSDPISEYTINGDPVADAIGENMKGVTGVVADKDIKVVGKFGATEPEPATDVTAKITSNEGGEVEVVMMVPPFFVMDGSTIPVGTELTVKANAKQGYEIKRFAINGNEYPGAVGRTQWTVSYKVEDAFVYEVEFAAKAADPVITYTFNEEGGNVMIEATGDDWDEWEVVSGSTVAPGTTLTLYAMAADGYTIGSIVANGTEIADAPGNGFWYEMFYPRENLNIEVVFVEEGEPGYCNNYGDLNHNRGDRNLKSLTLSGVVEGDTTTLLVNNIQNPRGKIYNDRTDEVFNINPGELVTIKADGNGSWMHGYVWVDWNNDMQFDAVFDENGAVANNSELVAFNYYNGVNSNGEETEDRANGYTASLEFKVPADLAEGEYRLRYIIAWNNIDPCGEKPVYDENGDIINDGEKGLNPFTHAGGSITDITLRYEKPAPTTAVVTYYVGQGGRMTVMNMSTYDPVQSGNEVKIGDTVLFKAFANIDEETGEEYVIDSFIIGNDTIAEAKGASEMQRYVTVEEDLYVEVTFALVPAEEPGYCNNYEGINSEHSGRNLKSITLSGNDNTLTVNDIQPLYGPIYNDRTDEVFDITPGELVTLTTSGNGEWMHGYVWVDWNNDKEFVAVLDEKGAVADNSELVAFTYYNEVNSKGEPVPGNSQGYRTSLEFNVPADLTEGTYRLRYIIAWDDIDPCGEKPEYDENGNLLTEGGYNPLWVVGGSITDITLRYDKLTGVSAVEAAEGVAPVYYNLQGVRVNNPANGVYIMVRGDKAQKVYLRK